MLDSYRKHKGWKYCFGSQEESPRQRAHSVLGGCKAVIPLYLIGLNSVSVLSLLDKIHPRLFMDKL